MKKIPLSEILTSSVKTLPPHASVFEALDGMALASISCIVIVDAERRPLGIFTERDAVHLLAGRRGLGSLKMADVMSAPPFSSTSGVDFREAFRILQERGFRHLVVVDEHGCLLGIVTEGDFLHQLDVGDLSEFKSAEKVMSRNVVTVDVGDTLADAIGLMSRNRYSCVVVTREQTPHGILTERDVVRLAPSAADLAGMTVGSVVRTPLITAPPGMALPDAIKQMDRHKIRHLVISEDNKLLGLLTRHDLVKTLQSSYVNFLHETVQMQRDELFKLSQQRSLFELHDAALAAAANAIFIADRQAVIQWANPAFSKLTGYTLEETVGKRIHDLVKSGKNSKEFYETLWETILGGRVWQGEIINKRKNGTLCHEEMTITPVHIGSDEITHFIAVKQDITERKATQKQMESQLAFTEAVINAEVDALAVCHGIAEPPYVSFTIWNPSMETLTGYGMEEINRLGWYQTVYSDTETQEKARQRMERMRRGDHLRGEEWTITRKDGEHRIVQINTVIVAEDNLGAHVLAVMHDITERKHAEMQLRNSEERYRQVIQTSMDGFWIVDTQGHILDVNDSYCQLVGYTREELLSMRISDVEAKETPEETAQHMREIMSKGYVRFETHHRRKDGQMLFIEVSAVYRMDAGSGNFFVFMRDITERKQTEAALRESEQRFRAVFQNSADAILLHPLAGEAGGLGRFIEVNAAAIARYGYSREELLAMTPVELDEVRTYPTHEDLKAFQDNARQAGHLLFERIHVAKDGRRIPVEVSSHIFEFQGETVMLSIVRDITGRKEYEEELMRSNAELEQFSYAVSHDMRQPLRMISSYLQLLEKSFAGQLDGERRDYFAFAIEGAKRIDQMLVALLEYSRIGRMGEPPTWIESRVLLDEALQFLQPALAEAQANLSVAGEWPSILASHDEIQRLMQNLIGNAIKYRIAGRIPEITITSGTVKNEWRLCVADNGVGIIPEQIKRLFQVFQRLQSREAYEGTGIGLALCRKIAEHHKGRIWAESAGEGKGSKFCVALPVLCDKQSPRYEKI